jgi:hypothetical protein
MEKSVHHYITCFWLVAFNASTLRVFQSAKQAARGSPRMVSAPSRIAADRFRNRAEGLLADRPLGFGNTEANRAACVALNCSGPTPK